MNTIILFALFSHFFAFFLLFFSAEVQFQIAIFLHFRNAFSGEGQFQIAIILHFWRNLIKSRFHYTTKATPPINIDPLSIYQLLQPGGHMPGRFFDQWLISTHYSLLKYKLFATCVSFVVSQYDALQCFHLHLVMQKSNAYPPILDPQPDARTPLWLAVCGEPCDRGIGTLEAVCFQHGGTAL